MTTYSLGNTFFEDEVSGLALERCFPPTASARLAKLQTVYLSEVFLLAWLRQPSQKDCLAHFWNTKSLMRAWIAGLILAIFGLWLATI